MVDFDHACAIPNETDRLKEVGERIKSYFTLCLRNFIAELQLN